MRTSLTPGDDATYTPAGLIWYALDLLLGAVEYADDGDAEFADHFNGRAIELLALLPSL